MDISNECMAVSQSCYSLCVDLRIARDSLALLAPRVIFAEAAGLWVNSFCDQWGIAWAQLEEVFYKRVIIVSKSLRELAGQPRVCWQHVEHWTLWVSFIAPWDSSLSQRWVGDSTWVTVYNTIFSFIVTEFSEKPRFQSVWCVSAQGSLCRGASFMMESLQTCLRAMQSRALRQYRQEWPRTRRFGQCLHLCSAKILNMNDLKWIEMKWIEMKWVEMKWKEVKWNELKWNERKWIDMKWNKMRWINWIELTWIEMNWNEMNWNEMKGSELTWIEMTWNEMRLMNWPELTWNELKWNELL